MNFLRSHLKTKSIDPSRIYCHPEIVEIYKFVGLNQEDRLKNLSEKMLIMMMNFRPVHVVIGQENKFLFIANWELIFEARRRKIKKVPVLILADMTNEEVRTWCVMSVVANFVTPQTEFDFKNLSLLLEDPKIRRKLFENVKPRSSASAISYLTGKSRSQVRTLLREDEPVKTALELRLETLNES